MYKASFCYKNIDVTILTVMNICNAGEIVITLTGYSTS